jgi:HSP20 family protein
MRLRLWVHAQIVRAARLKFSVIAHNSVRRAAHLLSHSFRSIAMTRVSLYDPLSDVFPTLFRNVFADPVLARETAATAPARAAAPRIDVIEQESGYVLRADMPGVAKDAINIDIEANRVTIRADVKRDDAASGSDRILRSERYVGALARSVVLADEVDEAAATATFENGVLELTLPRKAGVGPKRVTVQ